MRLSFYAAAIFLGLGLASQASALTVSPAKIEIAGNPGQTLTGSIELLNEQKNDQTFYTSFENFEPKGDSGAPYFIGAKDGLATWLTTQPQVSLNAGKRITVPYSLTIPANAEPGGHFAAVFFGTEAPRTEAGGQVSLGGKIGVLVLLRVNGDIKEEGGLVDFTTKNNQKFFSYLPAVLSYRLNNTGGDRIVPAGDVEIKNTFRLTTEKLSANKNEGSVLPGSMRRFNVVWGGAPMTAQVPEAENLGFFAAAAREWSEFHFGWYTAVLSIAWGTTNQSADASYDFFVIPWHLLSIILLILLVVGFGGRYVIKRYNRYIIAQAAQQK